MNWSSEFHTTKANLRSLFRLDSSSSFCNSFSSSLEDWEFPSWLDFSALLSLQTSQIVSVEMDAPRLSLNFAASQQEIRTNSWIVFSCDWLASLLSRFWLVDGSGLKYYLARWILHFSPQNGDHQNLAGSVHFYFRILWSHVKTGNKNKNRNNNALKDLPQNWTDNHLSMHQI